MGARRQGLSRFVHAQIFGSSSALLTGRPLWEKVSFTKIGCVSAGVRRAGFDTRRLLPVISLLLLEAVRSVAAYAGGAEQ